MKKEVFVGLGHFFNVIVADGALAGRVFLAQPLFQHLRRGLQINHQIGRGQLRAKIIVKAIVNFQLLIVQVQAGEQLVFFKNIIGHNAFARIGAVIQGM